MPSVLLAGRYRMEQLVGCGPVSEVWQSTDLALARTVAVKQLLAEPAEAAEALTCFRDAASRTGSVSHPGIARIFDYGEPEPPGRAFVVMEFVDGSSLTQLLHGGPMPADRAMEVLAQAAAAVHAAHFAGCAGLQLAPRSIMVSTDGTVKLTSLGLTTAAPGPGAVADLRALGRVAYSCLTGQLADEQSAGPLAPLPPQVPAPAAELTWRLLEADGDQLPDCEEIAQAAASLAGRAPMVHTVPASPAAELDATRTRPRSAAVIDAPAAVTAVTAVTAQGRRAGSRAGQVVRFSAVFALVAAAVVMWTMLRPGGQAAHPATAAAVRMVNVHAARLTGKPVRLVRAELRRLGLRVLVRWQPTSSMQPGLVISIRPAGRRPVGSLVRVVGALQPGSTRDDRAANADHARRKPTPHPHRSAGPTSSPSPSPSPSATSSGSPSPSPSQSTTPAPSGSPSPSDSPQFRHQEERRDDR